MRRFLGGIMFVKEEIKQWEMELDARKIQLHYPNQKGGFDPRKEALVRHRHRSPYPRMHEDVEVRKQVQRRFRAQMKEWVLTESELTPCNHDYKTYGWETW